MTCFHDGCEWAANYWYIAQGKRIGYCFGHATQQVYDSGRYGYRERKR